MAAFLTLSLDTTECYLESRRLVGHAHTLQIRRPPVCLFTLFLLHCIHQLSNIVSLCLFDLPLLHCSQPHPRIFGISHCHIYVPLVDQSCPNWGSPDSTVFLYTYTNYWKRQRYPYIHDISPLTESGKYCQSNLHHVRPSVRPLFQ